MSLLLFLFLFCVIIFIGNFPHINSYLQQNKLNKLSKESIRVISIKISLQFSAIEEIASDISNVNIPHVNKDNKRSLKIYNFLPLKTSKLLK